MRISPFPLTMISTIITLASFSQQTPEHILTKASSNIKEPSDAAKLVYNMGVDYFQEKDYPAAVRQFERAIALEPDYIDAYNELGLTFYEAASFDSAYHYLQISLHKLPTGTTALQNIGLVEEKRDHLPQALEYYKKIESIAPDNPEGYYNDARVLATMGRLDESVTPVTQAEKLYAKTKSPIIGECYLLQLIIYYNLHNKPLTKKYRDLCKKVNMDVPAELQTDPN